MTALTAGRIFSVTNHHTPACGTPPQIDDTTPDRYCGYFENRYGEQAIFVYDYARRQGTLYLGDAGWQTPYAVVDGQVPDLLLGREEQAWLRLCWRAARAQARLYRPACS
jgi:hypothetical protein